MPLIPPAQNDILLVFEDALRVREMVKKSLQKFEQQRIITQQHLRIVAELTEFIQTFPLALVSASTGPRSFLGDSIHSSLKASRFLIMKLNIEINRSSAPPRILQKVSEMSDLGWMEGQLRDKCGVMECYLCIISW